MGIQPVPATRASLRVVKKQNASPRPRKRKSRTADYEDDDWVPLAPTMTPTRVINEFIENDYDMM
jgi:hypothetical protein